MGELFGIYGAGGYGREVLPLVREQLKKKGGAPRVVFIVDNSEDSIINGVDVVSFEKFCAFQVEKKQITIAIADSKIRESLLGRCQLNDIPLFNVVAENVITLDNVEIGSGAILSPFVCLTSDIKIGKSFHANIYSYIGHDCVVGDYVTLAPGVKCNGNVIIEDHAYIGTGAIIRPGTSQKPLRIGKGAVVGMGAVVTKSVPDGKTVFGNPAKILGK